MYVVQISVYYDWSMDVICPSANSDDAVKYAYEFAKKRSHYDLPDTVEQAMDNNIVSYDILSEEAELCLPYNLDVFTF